MLPAAKVPLGVVVPAEGSRGLSGLLGPFQVRVVSDQLVRAAPISSHRSPAGHAA